MNNLLNNRIYRIWIGIKQRCLNERCNNYHNYGGRGISICKEWLKDFHKFEEWSLNNGYNDCLSIERINVNGNYEPNNCKWATRKEQARNRRSNHLYKYKGEIKCIYELAEKYNINVKTLQRRLLICKWSIEKSIETPVRKHKKYKNAII